MEGLLSFSDTASVLLSQEVERSLSATWPTVTFQTAPAVVVLLDEKGRPVDSEVLRVTWLDGPSTAQAALLASHRVGRTLVPATSAPLDAKMASAHRLSRARSSVVLEQQVSPLLAAAALLSTVDLSSFGAGQVGLADLRASSRRANVLHRFLGGTTPLDPHAAACADRLVTQADLCGPGPSSEVVELLAKTLEGLGAKGRQELWAAVPA